MAENMAENMADKIPEKKILCGYAEVMLFQRKAPMTHIDHHNMMHKDLYPNMCVERMLWNRRLSQYQEILNNRWPSYKSNTQQDENLHDI